MNVGYVVMCCLCVCVVAEEVPERGEEEWREHFIPVGTTLLDRVFSNHTPLLPLPSTSS